MSSLLPGLSPRTNVLDGIKDLEVAGARVASKLHLALVAAEDQDTADRDRWLEDAVAEHAEMTRVLVWVTLGVVSVSGRDGRGRTDE